MWYKKRSCGGIGELSCWAGCGRFGNRLWIWVPIGLAANAIALIQPPNDKALLISLVCQLVISVFLGVKGSEWAWKSRKWESLERFKKTQDNWRRWGIILSIVGFTIGVFIGGIGGSPL